MSPRCERSLAHLGPARRSCSRRSTRNGTVPALPRTRSCTLVNIATICSVALPDAQRRAGKEPRRARLGYLAAGQRREHRYGHLRFVGAFDRDDGGTSFASSGLPRSRTAFPQVATPPATAMTRRRRNHPADGHCPDVIDAELSQEPHLTQCSCKANWRALATRGFSRARSCTGPRARARFAHVTRTAGTIAAPACGAPREHAV